MQETAMAIASFQTNEEGRLSFDKGQLIYIRKKGDKGWYQGEIRVCRSYLFLKTKTMFFSFFLKASNQPVRVGWFPANCVQLQTISTPTSSISTYQNTPGIKSLR